MTREESMLAKRLVDLSRQSFQKGIITFSDFLNLNEQNIFHTCKPELYSNFRLSGGYEHAERQMIAFLPDALMFPVDFPIVCLRIMMRNQRFAEELTHRDVLGSLMNLGIERSKLGDILIREHQIYVLCHTSVHSFIARELTRIRHTSVDIQAEEAADLDIRPNMQPCDGTVTSNRLDAFLALMCKISRSQASDLIKKGCVFINGKETVQTSYRCNPEEIISIRGYGRFRFLQILGETRKGRIRIYYEKYM